MVFFTCNACGSSLKKNQVEKHWQNECPSCEVLSCIDCGKDFYGDEYAAHTKCISEAEKYQGSLYKESGGHSKGEKKQQEWLEKVRKSVSSAGVTPKIARLLERIAEYPNIPRKKAKFVNFVQNSCNVRDQRTLEQLWAAFAAMNEKIPKAAADSAALGAPENGSDTQAVQAAAGDAQTEQEQRATRRMNEDGLEPKRKRKKKCAEGEGGATVEEETGEFPQRVEGGKEEELDTGRHSLKKKHKKAKLDKADSLAQQDALPSAGSGKKKRHKERDKMKGDVDAETTDAVPPSVAACSPGKQHRKKRHSEAEGEGVTKKARVNADAVDESGTYKKKKHKHKIDANA